MGLAEQDRTRLREQLAQIDQQRDPLRAHHRNLDGDRSQVNRRSLMGRSRSIAYRVASRVLPFTLALIGAAMSASAPDGGVAGVEWRVVVNNGMTMPGDIRTFNSYNQPSANVDGLVVFRARSRGGSTGEPAHGVFSRQMALGTPVSTVFDRHTLVPSPNNLGTKFVEPPSFPRLDMWSNTVASRGNHPPAWEYIVPNETATRGGTTGIYTNPFGALISGASNLGAAPGLDFFAVPGTSPPIKFDVFPGAPASTDTATIVFKGNYSVSDPSDPSVTTSKTGVYYRDLMDASAGGTGPVIAIADAATAIPGAAVRFGAVAPPSAAGRVAVFTGWDNESSPTVGGIYLAPLDGTAPPLSVLVRIGEHVPGEPAGTLFSNLGESLSFDGRFVAFWGTWGSATRTLVLQCPREGNKDRLEYCRTTHPSGFMTTVPVHQGIFVHDTKTGHTRAIAKSPDDFADFIYWNFSGMVPGATGHADDDGEPARWRSATFVAVSGLVDDRHTDATFHTVFKARTGQVVGGAYVDPLDGLYLRTGPGASWIATLVRTAMDATLIDPAAVESVTREHLSIADVGVERDGFRGRWLAINVSMGTEESGWAGIYVTEMPARLY